MPCQRGNVAVGNCTFVNALLWMCRTGALWRDLPECYGKWITVCRRFNRWSRSGAIEHLFTALQEECVLMLLYIVKRLGVLFWVGCRVYPLDGPLLEFGKVACAAFDLADAARGHAERLADLLLGDVPADA